MDEMNERRGMSRRDALKRGAIVGGAVWVVPAVHALSMSSASAQAPSGGLKRSDGSIHPHDPVPPSL